MKTVRYFAKFCIILIITAALYACFVPDYFSMYSGKNLIGHTILSEWALTQNTTYMTYESVSAAVAGTAGLPDAAAQIYRLEIKNMVPDGDFDLAATPAAAGWIGTGGTISIANNVWTTGNQALSFSLGTSNWIDFDLDQLNDTGLVNSNYVFRFRFSGSATTTFYYEIEDTSTAAEPVKFPVTLGTAGQAFNVPYDFNEVPTTEFLIHPDDTEIFRINYNTSGAVMNGYFDDFRIIRTDMSYETRIEIPYEDASRVDSLELISGTYRFSIWVKADPELAARNNSFASRAVTIKVESFDPDGTGGSQTQQSFNASDNSGFTGWTQLYVDATFQINEPSDVSDTMIRISLSPTDETSGSVSMDAGSILISNPSLSWSSDGVF